MSKARALDAPSRIDRYRRANGTWKLTPRQRRRVVHKHNRSLAPFVAADLHQHEDPA